MFEKHKVKKALCKAHKFYSEKKIPYLKVGTMNLYKQLQDIQYAIAYVLCECFDFNYKFYYNENPFTYKWFIANDYVNHFDECKKAYEEIVKENNNTTKYDYIAWSINDFKGHYAKGDIIYNMENGCLYMYDGKKFVNMC